MVSPHEYRALRSELDRLWGLDSIPGFASSGENAEELAADDTLHRSSISSSEGSTQKLSPSKSLDSSTSLPSFTEAAAGADGSGRITAREALADKSEVPSESPCSKVEQSPSGVPLKLAEKPAASTSGAITVLDIRQAKAEPDSRAAASKLVQLSTTESSPEASSTRSSETEATSASISSTSQVVQDPLDPLPHASMDPERLESNALASSSGRMQDLDSSAAISSNSQSTKAHSRRQLTSRKKHWAAKAAAALVAEASRVTAAKDSTKRTLRRPPSLKLTVEQLEVHFHAYHSHNRKCTLLDFMF